MNNVDFAHYTQRVPILCCVGGRRIETGTRGDGRWRGVAGGLTRRCGSPMVDMNVVVNASSENLYSMHVLPTPESPISSSLNSRSYVFLAIATGCSRGTTAVSSGARHVTTRRSDCRSGDRIRSRIANDGADGTRARARRIMRLDTDTTSPTQTVRTLRGLDVDWPLIA